MNLPLMSSAALDNAVYELIARELGVANAMRFIAGHCQPDGIDYTVERKNWLPRGAAEVEDLFNEPNPDFERLVAVSRKKGRGSRRQGGMSSGKDGTRKQK